MSEKMTSPLFFMRETPSEILAEVLQKRLRELKELSRKLEDEKTRSDELNDKLKQVVRKLILTENKFKNLYEESPDLYRTVNTDGIILECNQIYYKKLGYSSKKNVIGTSVFDHVTVTSLPSMKKSFETWKKTGLSRNHTVWMKTKDGKVFPTLVSASSLYDQTGKLIGSNTVIRDISNIFEERKKTEEEKTKKLAAIGGLASRLAHDLRNPLSIIKNTCELVRIGTKEVEDKSLKNKYERIERAISRMSNQIDNVLDFVKEKPLKLKQSLLSEVLALSIERIKVPSDVRINPPQNDVKIICDSEQLEIVLINLISNAIQAMENRGEINIRVTKENSSVLIEVEDFGPGIPDDLLPKIFEPLFTTRQTGTGLGLLSCKTIVERHQGKIEVESTVGNGTTFKIRLPQNKKQQIVAK